jgi:hypothetical protein
MLNNKKNHIYEIIKCTDYYALNQTQSRGITKVHLKDHTTGKTLIRRGKIYVPSNSGFIDIHLEGKKVMLSSISTGDKWTIGTQSYKDDEGKTCTFYVAKLYCE